MSAHAGIAVRGVDKHFGAVHALRDVHLEVAPGELVALLGPNGAGKSTLLRILGTTLLPDGGDVYVAGQNAVKDPVAARRGVGLLLVEERSWYWRVTGRHNLEFFGALHGMRRREAARRAQELLEEVELVEAADRPFGQYSSGMTLRLSLARALLASPPVLLLDEPTRSLDPLATRHFRDILLPLAHERGTAVLFATHDLHEAAELASRVVILKAGQLHVARSERSTAADLEHDLIEA